jgi:hypothetical protein
MHDFDTLEVLILSVDDIFIGISPRYNIGTPVSLERGYRKGGGNGIEFR